jgi:hypothetical protein
MNRSDCLWVVFAAQDKIANVLVPFLEQCLQIKPMLKANPEARSSTTKGECGRFSVAAPIIEACVRGGFLKIVYGASALRCLAK